MQSEIHELKAAGRYREAAALLSSRGETAAAARLLAEVWDFAGALELARHAGHVVDAYRYAVEAKDAKACGELRDMLEQAPDLQVFEQLIDFASRRGRHEDAAYFCLWSEDLSGAARHFSAAGRPLMAAKLLVTRGRAREAAEMLARSYKLEPDPEVTLGLGQALFALGRYQKALELVQAERVPDPLYAKQQRLIARCLRQVGLDRAAEGVEARLGGSGTSTLHGIRYLALGNSSRLYDRWLRRACDEEFFVGASRREQLLAYARVVHPNVQQVYDLTDEHAVIESPQGVLLSSLSRGEQLARVGALLAQLDDGLRALANANLAHGEVDEEHVLVSAHRLVLLIPRSPMPSATVQGDREALRQLRRRVLMTPSRGGS